MKRLALLCSVALSACAMHPPSPPVSLVDPLTPAQSQIVAYDISLFVLEQLPGGAARVAVFPAPKGDTISPLLPKMLEAQSVHMAYGKDAEAADVHQLRYQVAPLDQGILLHIWLDRGDATQLLRHSGAGLEPAGPFSYRSAGS